MDSAQSEVVQGAELLNWLPHRYPFLLIDKVFDVVPGVEAKGLKAVTFNEPFFPGHFPNKPVMPGVLQLESLAQLCCVLAFKTKGTYNGENVYLVGFNKVRYRRVVEPGDLLSMHAKVAKSRKNLWIFDCQAKVGDDVAVDAEILAGFDA